MTISRFYLKPFLGEKREEGERIISKLFDIWGKGTNENRNSGKLCFGFKSIHRYFTIRETYQRDLDWSFFWKITRRRVKFARKLRRFALKLKICREVKLIICEWARLWKSSYDNKEKISFYNCLIKVFEALF